MKPVIVSGIQPSGKLHIGNYLGALKNFVELQNLPDRQAGSGSMYDCLFFIADLHSLTEEFYPKEKISQIIDLAASYLAAGLNPKKSTLFIQSHVPAHSELGFILNTITPMGELERMTQYKDKSKVKINESFSADEVKKMEEIYEDKTTKTNNAGLFTYPVLMAADILLYDTAFVPVGDDQDQHLELTRTLARKFNSRFGQTFLEPRGLHTAIPRLMSLDDPIKKMSKSRPVGCLFIDDEPEIMKKKLMAAVTDSDKEILFDPKNKPGIANLLLLASAISNHSIADLEKQFKGANYGEFKAKLGHLVVHYFADFRAAKQKLLAHPNKILAAFAKGAKTATVRAKKKMSLVREKLGLR